MVASGKSTLAMKLKDDNTTLICFDYLFGYEKEKRTQEITNIIKELEMIYPETKNQIIFKRVNNKEKIKIMNLKYYEYTEKFYNYLLENVKKPIIIEGLHFYRFMDIKPIKGKIIIKRTSLLHSYIRAFKRDVCSKGKKYLKGEIKLDVLKEKFCQRIKIPITTYIRINKYIKQIMEMEIEK